MNIINYEREMEKIISGLDREKKPRLLLHACCAPCASASVERIKEFFDVTLYFYNPNMDALEEYLLRAKELERLANHFGVKYIIDEYNHSDFLDVAKGLENQKEGGARCVNCFNLRLNATAKRAKELDCEYFATTLSISPLKNAGLLNQIGEQISSRIGVKYLPTDFKKKNGYVRSIELSKQLDLYRQNYCGCEFSKVERSL